MGGKDKDRDNEEEGYELFKKGTQVEVSSDEEGFRGAWFQAIIISPPSKSNPKGKALVQYQSLLSDDECKPLTECVEVSFVRPLPPPQGIDQSFEPHDVVDAFYCDGWWKGVVTEVKIFKEKNNSSKRYFVVFEDPPDQMEFSPSDLRFHWEWINGKWVRPPKQKRMKGLNFSTGMAVEVNLSEKKNYGAWFPATVLEEVGFNSFLVKYDNSIISEKHNLKKLSVDSFHIRPPPPYARVKNFDLLEKVDAFYGLGWRAGFITKVLTKGRYTVVLKHSKEERQFSHSEIRPHLYLINGKWVSSCKDRSISSYCQEQLSDANNNAKSTEEAMQLGITGATEDRIELTISCPNSSMKPAEQSTPCNEKSESKRAKTTTSNSEVTLMCPSKKLKMENPTNLLNSSACRLDSMPIEMPEQEASVINGTVTRCSNHLVVGTEASAESESPFLGKNVDINQQEAALKDEMMVYAVNRKRLSNSPAKSQQIPKAGGEDTPEQDSIEDIVEVQHTAAKEVNLSVILAEGTRGSDSKTSCQPPDEVFLEDTTNKDSIEDTVGVQDTAAKEVGLSLILAEGTRSLSPKTSCHLPDEEINLQSEAYTRQQQKGASGEMSDIVPSTNYLAKEADVVMAETSCGTSTEERQVETVMRSPVVNVPVNSEAVGNQMMPFIKNSSIWEKLESLEVFQHMPQKPHFLPLASYKEVSREGFALGHMVIFATLADKTSKLQVDDPKNLFESYLDTLADLEMLGFEAKAVVDRLTKLLSIKDKLGQLQDRSEEAQIQIIGCIRKKTELGEEIDAIDKEISVLKQKRAFDMSAKEKKDSKIATLELDATIINEDISKAEKDFETLAAASWHL